MKYWAEMNFQDLKTEFENREKYTSVTVYIVRRPTSDNTIISYVGKIHRFWDYTPHVGIYDLTKCEFNILSGKASGYHPSRYRSFDFVDYTFYVRKERMF